MSSAVSTFTSDKRLLKEILGEIQSGKIQLPDFQRGWVWDDEHIRDLLTSISLSYPIGTIMLLKTSNPTQSEETETTNTENNSKVRFKARRVEGAPLPEEKPHQLILDGQQRLTSLFQALFSEQAV